MSNIYFISDCHFGHRNITKYRTEFASMEDHEKLIFENIMSTLTKRDTLWMLGDMFFNREVLYKYGVPISKQAGYTHLVLGNHDTDSDERKQNVEHMVRMFDSVHSLHKHYGFWLSHAPLHPAELRGKMNIHGHVHYATIPDENYVNVSCENVNYKPVSLVDIREGWRGNV